MTVETNLFFMIKSISAEDAQKGENVWHWDDMDEEEDAMWADGDSDDEDMDEDGTINKDALTYDQLDKLDLLLDVVANDPDACRTSLLQIIHDEVSSAFTIYRSVCGSTN